MLIIFVTKDTCFPATDSKDQSQLFIVHLNAVRQLPTKESVKRRQTCEGEDRVELPAPVMLTSAHILICASPRLRGHMQPPSAQDWVKVQQAGMRHHRCKLNEVNALGGSKIMGSSLESSDTSGLTVKFNSIPPHVSDLILPVGFWLQLRPESCIKNSDPIVNPLSRRQGFCS